MVVQADTVLQAGCERLFSGTMKRFLSLQRVIFLFVWLFVCLFVRGVMRRNVMSFRLVSFSPRVLRKAGCARERERERCLGRVMCFVSE